MLTSFFIVCLTIASVYTIGRLVLWGAEKAVNNTDTVLTIGYVAIAAVSMRLLYGWLPVILSAPACGAVAYGTYNRIYPHQENSASQPKALPHVSANQYCPQKTPAWHCYSGNLNKTVCGSLTVTVGLAVKEWPERNKSTNASLRVHVEGSILTKDVDTDIETTAATDNKWLPSTVSMHADSDVSFTVSSSNQDLTGILGGKVILGTYHKDTDTVDLLITLNDYTIMDNAPDKWHISSGDKRAAKWVGGCHDEDVSMTATLKKL